MSVPVIQAVNLSRVYVTPASRIAIFEGLNLSVAEGSMIAVVGPSGAGKSTLMHLLGGLDRPDGGEVLFRGESIFSFSRAELARYRNRSLGFVFQFHHLLPEFTALENTAMPLLVRGLPRAEAQGPARELLERVGLGDRLEHQIGELSGGEQQRVAIARALVGDPALLLADEPTGNLDPRTGNEVYEVIRDLHRERGLTSLIVTHNEVIAAGCDEIWEIRDGRLGRANGPGPGSHFG